MKFQDLIWIPCLIGITTVTASIEKTAQIGENIKIGKGATIKSNSVIGRYCDIGMYSSVGDGATIGELSISHDFSRIGSDAKVLREVYIGMHSSVGDRATIGESVMLYDFSRIGSDAKVQRKVYVGFHSSVGDRATIGESVMLYDFSRIGSDAKVQREVYVGLYTSVGVKAFIGELAMLYDHSTISELAVLHNYVVIPSGMTVKKGDVVFPTPSSLELYRFCAETVSDEQAEIAIPKKDGSPSAEFNQLMRHLIGEEMKTLSKHCAQSNETMKPKTLPRIMSLYLIQYHGLKRFNDYVRQAKHGFDDDGTLECKLSNEFHFGKNTLRKILKSEVKETLLLLLETDKDAERKNRVEGDTFCKLFDQIKSGERKLSLSEREIENC